MFLVKIREIDNRLILLKNNLRIYEE